MGRVHGLCLPSHSQNTREVSLMQANLRDFSMISLEHGMFLSCSYMEVVLTHPSSWSTKL